MIKCYTENVEDMLLAHIVAFEQRVAAGRADKSGFLRCLFSEISQSLAQSDLERLLEGLFKNDEDIHVFFFPHGDIVFSWKDAGYVPDMLIEVIGARYEVEIEKNNLQNNLFFQVFDSGNFRLLRDLCEGQRPKRSKKGEKLLRILGDPKTIQAFRYSMEILKKQRIFRAEPHILIIEDQVFSQKMLLSALTHYTTYFTSTSGDGLLLCMEKCPDIIFLDIELPDISGHDFAELIRKIDPDMYIVMVSSNHNKEDIEKAKQNHVNGYIAKPYKKSAILESIENFKKLKKSKLLRQA